MSTYEDFSLKVTKFTWFLLSLTQNAISLATFILKPIQMSQSLNAFMRFGLFLKSYETKLDSIAMETHTYNIIVGHKTERRRKEK